MKANLSKRRRRRRRAALKVGLIAIGVMLLLAAGVVAVAAYLDRPPDARLVGTWQSDADATIAEHKKTKTVTDAQEQVLRQIFGKTKVTYAAKTLTVNFADGTTDTQPYRVVSRDAESVVVGWFFQPAKKDELFLIVFESADVYWLDVPGLQMRECFRRVR